MLSTLVLTCAALFCAVAPVLAQNNELEPYGEIHIPLNQQDMLQINQQRQYRQDYQMQRLMDTRRREMQYMQKKQIQQWGRGFSGYGY